MFWNKNKIGELENKIGELEYEVKIYKKENERLKSKNESITFEDMMRASIGLPMINFSNVDKKGLPPHFLEGLNEDQRKNFMLDVAGMYSNDRFQTIFDYAINLVGNHAIHKEDIEQIKMGQLAILGIRTVKNEFEKLFNEYESSKKLPEQFDPLDILPE